MKYSIQFYWTTILFVVIHTALMGQKDYYGLAYNKGNNEGQRWAVFIGIDTNVKGDTLTDKKTANQQKLESLLQHKYGYQPDHIIHLYNENATARNIYKIYDRLTKEMGPYDSFFMYFSANFIIQNDEKPGIEKSTTKSFRQSSPIGQSSQLVYFVPFDAVPNEPYTWMDMNDILNSVFKLPMNELFFVIDDCLTLPGAFEKNFIATSAGKKMKGSYFMTNYCKSAWNADLISSSFSGIFIDELRNPDPANLNALSTRILAKSLQDRMSLFDVQIATFEFNEGFVFHTSRDNIDPGIIRQMEPDNPESVRMKAIAALVKFVNGAATNTKRKITEEAIINHLVPIIRNANETPPIRAKSIEALTQLDYPESIKYVGEILNQKGEYEVHQAAYNALRKYELDSALPYFRNALKNPFPEIRINAIQTLAFVPDKNAATDIVNLAVNDKNESVQIAALEVLPQFEPLSVEQENQLSQLLSDGHPDNVRKVAINTLSSIGAVNILDQVSQILSTSQNYELRESAVYALTATRDSSYHELVETALVNALKTDTSSRVRDAAAFGLGRHGGKAAENQLINTVRDKKKELNTVRVTAIYSLGFIRSHKCVKELIDLTQDKDSQIKLASINALGVIGDEIALEPLYRALKDDNYYVREAAQKSISDIQNIQEKEKRQQYIIQDLSDTLSNIRLEAVLKIKDLNEKELVPNLIPMMGDREYAVRESAVLVLSQFDDPVSLNMISQTLTNQSVLDKFLLRAGAARVLGNIGDENYIPVLFRGMKDQNSTVRSAVISALGKMDDNIVFDSLLIATEDSDNDVRHFAAEALANQCFRLYSSSQDEVAYQLGEQSYNRLEKNLGKTDPWTKWFDLLVTRRNVSGSGISMHLQRKGLDNEPGGPLVVMDGDSITCVVRNESKYEVFVSLLDMRSNGKAIVVKNAFVSARDILAIDLKATIPKGSDKEGDRFKMFVTPYRLDFQQLLDDQGKGEWGRGPMRFSELISSSLKSISEKYKDMNYDSWEIREAYLEVIPKPISENTKATK